MSALAHFSNYSADTVPMQINTLCVREMATFMPVSSVIAEIFIPNWAPGDHRISPSPVGVSPRDVWPRSYCLWLHVKSLGRCGILETQGVVTRKQIHVQMANKAHMQNRLLDTCRGIYVHVLIHPPDSSTPCCIPWLLFLLAAFFLLNTQNWINPVSNSGKEEQGKVPEHHRTESQWTHHWLKWPHGCSMWKPTPLLGNPQYFPEISFPNQDFFMEFS